MLIVGGFQRLHDKTPCTAPGSTERLLLEFGQVERPIEALTLMRVRKLGKLGHSGVQSDCSAIGTCGSGKKAPTSGFPWLLKDSAGEVRTIGTYCIPPSLGPIHHQSRSCISPAEK